MYDDKNYTLKPV